MIAQLRGMVVQTGDRWVVVDVNGIGYQVQVTQPALAVLSRRQDPVTLYTHMAVREDAIVLFGFLHPSELEMFRVLIGVTGIGPQTAISLLSQIGIEEFALAILNEDEKTLTRIPGIGTKSAKRLILELRDKMKSIGKALASAESGQAGPVVNDAISALISLGFAERESRDAVMAASAGGRSASVQDLIKAALAKLKDR